MIALLTDFGIRDPFVGLLKGVIAGINPNENVIDLTHEIAPHDIRQAAMVLGDSYRYFPKGTIFICVIDPGVGSNRRPVCLQAGEHFFIGPDNGIFSVPIARHHDAMRAWEITSTKYLLPIRGNTFHGRDIFAPAGAWLSTGISPEELGPEAQGLASIGLPCPVVSNGVVTGEVIMIDRFGNAITNIRRNDLCTMGKGPVVAIKGMELDLLSHYAAGDDGAAHGVVNSEGRLEVFVNMASAAQRLGISVGDEVRVYCTG